MNRNPSTNTRQRYISSAPVALLACSAGLFLATSNLAAQPAESEEIFELSPFAIDGSQDEGYRATSSLAGSRLRSDLKDIGAAISVVTKDLMQDLGANDLNELLLYTTNTEAAGLGGNFSGASFGAGERVSSDSVINNPDGALRVRGLGSPDKTRGYFLSSIPFDSYNSDRVDISRGANSILFGLGSPAGVLNSGIYSANTNKDHGEIRFRIGSGAGSDLSYRTEIDYNKVLLDDKLAVRITALDDDRRFQQDPAFNDQSRIYAALAAKPWKGATFNLNHESGNIISNNPDPLAPVENITAYIDELHRFQSLAAANGTIGVLPSSWDPNNLPLYADTFNVAIKNERGANPAYRKPQTVVADYTNPFSTGGTSIFKNIVVVYDDKNEALPSNSFLGQIRPQEASNANLYAANGGAPAGYAVPGNSIVNAIVEGVSNVGQKDPNLAITSVLDRSLYDFTRHLLAGTAGSQTKDFEATSFSFAQTFWENAVGFEVAAYKEEYEATNSNPFRNTPSAITVDVQRTLPIGGLNPNFGRPYVIDRVRINNEFESRDALRLTSFAQYDFDKKLFADSFLGRLFGSHTLTGLYSKDEIDNLRYNQNENWISGDPVVQEMLNDVAGVKPFQRQVAYMTYVGPAVDLLSDPASLKATDFFIEPDAILHQRIPAPGESQTVQMYYDGQLQNYELQRAPYIRGGSLSNVEVESAAVVLQSRILDEALITTYGYREDTQSQREISPPPTDPNDVYGQDSTVDPLYFNLDGVDAVVSKGNTRSFSAVARLPRAWRSLFGSNDLSVFYSKSNNLSPDASRLDGQYRPLASPEGETEEIGINATLFEGKLNLRINRYESSAKNLSSGRLGGLMGEAISTRTLKPIQGAITNLVSIGDTHDEIITDPNDKYFGQPRYPNYDKTGQYINEIASLYGANVDLVNKTITVDPSHPYANTWIAAKPELILDPVTGELNGWFHQTPPNLSDTQDVDSKGYEAEIVYNPMKNWRMLINVSRQQTQTSNSLPNMAKLIADFNPVIYGTPGNPSFVGGLLSNVPARVEDDAGNTTALQWEKNVITPFYGITAFDGSASPEEREWRANFVTNYSFTEGLLSGFSVGGSLRWQDNAAIGYPIAIDAFGNRVPVVDSPYIGPEETNVGLRFGYKRKIMQNRVSWNVSLNLSNLTSDDDELIPVLTQPDGTYAQVRTPAPKTWAITNSFKF